MNAVRSASAFFVKNYNAATRAFRDRIAQVRRTPLVRAYENTVGPYVTPVLRAAAVRAASSYGIPPPLASAAAPGFFAHYGTEALAAGVTGAAALARYIYHHRQTLYG